MSKEYEDLLDQEVRKNHKKTIEAIQGFIFESYSVSYTDSETGKVKKIKVNAEKNKQLTQELLNKHQINGVIDSAKAREEKAQLDYDKRLHNRMLRDE